MTEHPKDEKHNHSGKSCSLGGNGCGCSHSAGGGEGHFHSHDGSENWTGVIIGAFLFGAAFIPPFPQYLKIGLFVAAYLLIGGDIVRSAFRNILRGSFFDENFLMTIATLGAFAIGEYPEAVAVMLFFKVGEFFQGMALSKSKKSIRELVELKPDYANIKFPGGIERVSPDSVEVGSVIVVRPGEKIPLDGTVESGSAFLDTSSLTGESVPRKAGPGDEVLAGMISKDGMIEIKTSKTFGESTASKILKLIENAASKKAPTEKFITKFARYYTPAVVFAALLIAVIPVLLYKSGYAPGLFSHPETFSEWIYKALVFLVISCPCALVISIPLGFFGGIGASSRRGILVKGANHLEALNKLSTLIWDKTGTLTRGVFRVTEINARNGFSENELLKMAAAAESHSNHPIARSIIESYGKEISEKDISDYREFPGLGVKAKISGKEIVIGNDKMMHRENIPHSDCSAQGTAAFLAVDGKYAGHIIISDEIKTDARAAVSEARKLGVERQIMLTGDSEENARRISEELGLDGYYAALLPHEKVEITEKIIAENRKAGKLTAFSGDGINDAPSIMRADIGISMGAAGSDAAIEAADIVLMTDEPMRVPEAIRIARRTKRVVWENIILSMGIKGLFLIMGAAGIATMWEAVFADVGVALIAIANASKLLRTSGLKKERA